jgi:hypothetical protein
MRKQPRDILQEGKRILDPVLLRFGFSFKDERSGPSSGGPYASASYVNGDRKLEVHYRWSLGLVTYHFGEETIDHESYMHVLLGTNGGNKYPGFSDDPIDGFKGLAYDLENFATAFLKGNFEEFSRFAAAAREWKKVPGFARLP